MKVAGLEKWGDSLVALNWSDKTISYYVEKNGMCFNVGNFIGKENKLKVFDSVNTSLMNVLLKARDEHFRIRIWYGDSKTGKSRNTQYNVVGRVGCTDGKIKLPTLIKTSRSQEGSTFFVDSVIRIDDIKTKRTLWQVPNFHVEDMKVYEIFGYGDYKYQVAKLSEDSGKWEVLASFKTEKQASEWVAFMKGESYREIKCY